MSQLIRGIPAQICGPFLTEKPSLASKLALKAQSVIAESPEVKKTSKVLVPDTPVSKQVFFSLTLFILLLTIDILIEFSTH